MVMRQHAEDSGHRHPLDPLNAAEIRLATEILRREKPVTTAARFVSVTRHEPPKEHVAFPSPALPDSPALPVTVPREAFVVLLEPRQHAVFEAVISLTAGSVLSWRFVPVARAPFTAAECVQCGVVTRADERIRAGLERRGISDPAAVRAEPWGIGTFTTPQEACRRVVWTLLYYRERPDDNPYAKPASSTRTRRWTYPPPPTALNIQSMLSMVLADE